MTFSCVYLFASARGEFPHLSEHLGSAPFSSNNATKSAYPRHAETWRAVLPVTRVVLFCWSHMDKREFFQNGHILYGRTVSNIVCELTKMSLLRKCIETATEQVDAAQQ